MRLSLLAGLAGVLALGAPAYAQQFDPNILTNMRVPNAQIALGQGGYRSARSINLSGKQWDLWQSGGSCVGFTSMYGTVTEARGFQQTDCSPQQNTGGWNPGGNNNNNGGRPNLDLATLKNMRVDNAKSTLSAAGYSFSTGAEINGQRWDMWRGRGQCVGFTSLYGTITEARSFNDRQCNGSGGNNNGGWSPGSGGNNSGGGWNGGRDFDLAGLRGLSVGSAQDRLRRAGYVETRKSEIDGRRWDLWQNDNYRNSCVGFASYNGSVSETDTFSVSRCGGTGQGNNGPGYGQARPDYNIGQLRDLAVNSAQSRLSQAGYQRSRQVTIDGSRWDLYYNDRYRNACVGFNSLYGDVAGVRNFDGDLCRNGVR